MKLFDSLDFSLNLVKNLRLHRKICLVRVAPFHLLVDLHVVRKFILLQLAVSPFPLMRVLLKATKH